MNRAGRKRIPFLFGIDFEMSLGFFVAEPLRQQKILFSFNGVGNIPTVADRTAQKISLESFPEELQVYRKRYSRVMEALSLGDSFLINLTLRSEIRTSRSLQAIFACGHAAYRLYVPGRFVCFSPECFVRIEDGKIRAFPMKGTIEADIEDAERIILDDYKESSEHNTIVDLLRNDLNRIARNVHVERFRYIDHVSTDRGNLLQVSSEIAGTLDKDYLGQLGTLFLKLLPAGSVSGAPKKRTLEIIRQAERIPRGFYTGVAGYFDGQTLDSCVLIRFIERDEEKMYFRSGGGITINSACESEYREAVRKIYLPIRGI